MSFINHWRRLFPKDKPWDYLSLAMSGATVSFLYQVLPLMILADLPAQSAQRVSLLLPLITAGALCICAWVHNRDLKKWPRKPEGTPTRWSVDTPTD